MKFKLSSLIVLLLTVGLTSCNRVDHNDSKPEPENVTPEPYINPSDPSSGEEKPQDNNNENSGEENQGEQGNTEPEVVEPIYDETPDNITNVDTNDLSALYSAFEAIGDNYTSTIKGFFNEIGGKAYYNHYQKNYVCNKTCYFTSDIKYTIPELDDYLSICNNGLVNLNNNYYSFTLQGSSKEERMSYSLKDSDLTNEIQNKRYQDDLFTLNDLKQTYFETNEFTRISDKKYECRKKEVCADFVAVCASDLINEGQYMTFERVTIELNPIADISIRLRLYAREAQSGKLIESHKDQENKPNWYMLFSEAYISNIGSTTFAPANELLK